VKVKENWQDMTSIVNEFKLKWKRIIYVVLQKLTKKIK
jgi:hypothetical protein